MFRRSQSHYGRTPEAQTPYQKAGQVWDERIGSARVQAYNWRLMAFGGLLLSAGLSAALVVMSLRGTVTPWVVEVDRLGHVQADGPADANWRPADAQIAYQLAQFIVNVRSLPADPVVLKRQWLTAYDFTNEKGSAFLNAYASSDDPFARLSRDQVAVEVTTVIRASASSFQVRWAERHFADGVLQRTENWTAILGVTIDVPDKADELRKNPLGVYVNAINWSKEFKP